MQAYSLDLRERIVGAVDRGMPRAEVARTFGVSASTITRYLRQRRQTGSLAARPRPGRQSRTVAAVVAGLQPLLDQCPDATQAEQAARWQTLTGQTVSPSSIRRAIRALDWTRKKASERQRTG